MQIAFYKGTRPGFQGIFNRLVRWWTNGPYSHCEMVIKTLPCGLSLCASSSFIDGGVRFKYIRLHPDNWDLIKINANPVEVAKWFELRKGAGYDTLGLFRFIGQRGDGHKDKYLCSESCGGSLGIVEPWRLDPNTLAAILLSWK